MLLVRDPRVSSMHGWLKRLTSVGFIVGFTVGSSVGTSVGDYSWGKAVRILHISAVKRSVGFDSPLSAK